MTWVRKALVAMSLVLLVVACGSTSRRANQPVRGGRKLHLSLRFEETFHGTNDLPFEVHVDGKPNFRTKKPLTLTLRRLNEDKPLLDEAMTIPLKRDLSLDALGHYLFSIRQEGDVVISRRFEVAQVKLLGGDKGTAFYPFEVPHFERDANRQKDFFYLPRWNAADEKPKWHVTWLYRGHVEHEEEGIDASLTKQVFEGASVGSARPPRTNTIALRKEWLFALRMEDYPVPRHILRKHPGEWKLRIEREGFQKVEVLFSVNAVGDCKVLPERKPSGYDVHIREGHVAEDMAAWPEQRFIGGTIRWDPPTIRTLARSAEALKLYRSIVAAYTNHTSGVVEGNERMTTAEWERLEREAERRASQTDRLRLQQAKKDRVALQQFIDKFGGPWKADELPQWE